MFLRKYVCVSFVDFWCYLATPDGKGGMDELATSITYDFASYFSEDSHFDAGRSSPVVEFLLSESRFYRTCECLSFLENACSKIQVVSYLEVYGRFHQRTVQGGRYFNHYIKVGYHIRREDLQLFFSRAGLLLQFM
jgi:hypothetical protein